MLLPFCQTPPLLPPPSWTPRRSPPHYSWAAIGIVMCAHTEEGQKGECLGERSQLLCVSECVWGWHRGREQTSRLMLELLLLLRLLPPRISPQALLSDSAGSFQRLRAGSGSDLSWMWDWDAPEEMLAKEWLMRASNSAVKGWPPCACTITTQGGDFGRPAFPRQL